VNEGSVVLQGAQTRRVLTLLPDVQMLQRKAFVRAPERAIKPQKASPESGGQPDETGTMPDALKEKILSEHPKEEK